MLVEVFTAFNMRKEVKQINSIITRGEFLSNFSELYGLCIYKVQNPLILPYIYKLACNMML